MSDFVFVAYVWSFYKPGDLYGDFFDHTLTIAEVKAACALRRLSPAFEGDSIDRERVRDIMLAARGKPVGS